MLERETLNYDHLGTTEKQFKLLDYNPSGFSHEELQENGYPVELRIHPWARPRGKNRINRQVFVSLTDTNPDPSAAEEFMNTIVDRDEFIDGILYAFPELQYREDYE